MDEQRSTTPPAVRPEGSSDSRGCAALDRPDGVAFYHSARWIVTVSALFLAMTLLCFAPLLLFPGKLSEAAWWAQAVMGGAGLAATAWASRELLYAAPLIIVGDDGLRWRDFGTSRTHFLPWSEVAALGLAANEGSWVDRRDGRRFWLPSKVTRGDFSRQIPEVNRWLAAGAGRGALAASTGGAPGPGKSEKGGGKPGGEDTASEEAAARLTEVIEAPPE